MAQINKELINSKAAFKDAHKWSLQVVKNDAEAYHLNDYIKETFDTYTNILNRKLKESKNNSGSQKAKKLKIAKAKAKAQAQKLELLELELQLSNK